MEASAIHAPARFGAISSAGPLIRLRSDEQLVGLLRQGSQDAFSAIYDRYRQRLFAYVRQMLGPGSRQDAEDLLQEVFARAYTALRADHREVNLRPWLYRIAHNRCIDHLRRGTPVTTELFENAGKPLHDPFEDVQRREDLRKLVADIGRLPEQQRSALLLRELNGLSYRDLAEALDVTVPAVKSLLVRARVELVETAEARATSCLEIRDELMDSYDHGLRTSPRVRRHLRECSACEEYRGALRGMQKSFAALSPIAAVGPLALVAKALGLGGSGGAAGAGSGALAGGGTLGAGLTTATACKIAAVVSTAAVAAGGAVEIEKRLERSPSTAGTGAAIEQHWRIPVSNVQTRAGTTPTQSALVDPASGQVVGGRSNPRDRRGGGSALSSPAGIGFAGGTLVGPGATMSPTSDTGLGLPIALMPLAPEVTGGPGTLLPDASGGPGSSGNSGSPGGPGSAGNGSSGNPGSSSGPGSGNRPSVGRPSLPSKGGGKSPAVDVPSTPTVQDPVPTVGSDPVGGVVGGVVETGKGKGKDKDREKGPKKKDAGGTSVGAPALEVPSLPDSTIKAPKVKVKVKAPKVDVQTTPAPVMTPLPDPLVPLLP